MHLSTVTRQKSTTLGSTFFSPHGNQNTFLQFGQPFEKFPIHEPSLLESPKRIIHVQPIVENCWKFWTKKKKKKINSMKRFKFLFFTDLNYGYLFISQEKEYYYSYKRCEGTKDRGTSFYICSKDRNVTKLQHVYICPSSNSLFSGPLGLPSPQL